MSTLLKPLFEGAESKACEYCGKTFFRDKRCTWKHWERVRLCSRECVGKVRSITADQTRLSLREAFERHVVRNKDGCWGWNGLTNKRGGYPIFPHNKKMYYAHRVSLELDGRPLAKGMYACHHCDNPICTRPDHLYAGTPADNVRDMLERGRARTGERNHFAKLTEGMVREIRASDLSDNQLAERYGVNRTNIYMVRARKTWKHVA